MTSLVWRIEGGTGILRDVGPNLRVLFATRFQFLLSRAAS
jgi:hypothetical protein